MSSRRARAVGVIAVSMIAASLASAVYLAPLLRRGAVALTVSVPSPPSMTTVSGETITFSFISGSTGWAAAAVTTDRLWIYGTSDGARSWRRLGSIDFLQETRVDELRFFDRLHGLVVLGTDAVFAYRTADGGRHWTSVPTPDTPVLYVTFTDPQHGWAGAGYSDTGTSRLFSTVDGGITWTELPAPPVDGGQLVFRSPTEGWLGGGAPADTVYSTGDGGLTWMGHPLPPPPPCAWKQFGCASSAADHSSAPPPRGFPSSALPTLIPGGGVAVDFYPACPTSAQCPPYREVEYVSFDMGSSWRYLPSPPGGGGYADVSFQDSNDWWVIRGNTLYETADAGVTWFVASSRLAYDTLQPTIVDAKHAWVVVQTVDDSHLGTRPNTVWELDMTSDGGLTWKQETMPVPG